MSDITYDRTIGSLVAQQADRARVFEWHGLDYCCGGKKSLEEACADKGLSLEQVRQDLLQNDAASQAGDQQDWTKATPGELIAGILATHHAYLRLELPRLAQLVTKVAAVHGGRHPYMIEVRDVFLRLRREMEDHMHEEEDVLFPTLRLMNSRGRFGMLEGDAHLVIHKMEREHESVGAMLSRIKELTGGYALPPDGCETFRVTLHGLMTLELDTHIHVHKENNILFAKALNAAA